MPELTVATFNVHWGRGRGHGFVPFDVPAACATLDADVIVLQESWAPDDAPSQHEATAAALGMELVAVSLGRSVLEPAPKVIGPAGDRSIGTGEWGVAILARPAFQARPIVRMPPLRLDKVDRVLLSVDLDVEGSSLTLVGTHFSHLEFGSVLHARPMRRGLPPTNRPAVFLGDMNMWGWCLSALAPRGWTRVGKGKTWPAHRPNSRIDHVLVAGGVTEVWSDVAPDLGSDHRAVRARISVP